MKRILSVLLAVVLVATFSLSTVALVAAENEPKLVVSSAEATPGDTVDVTISLVNNPGVASIKLKAAFPSDLTLTSVEFNTGLGGQSQAPSKFTSPVTLNWFNGGANTNGDMVFATLKFTVADNAKNGEKDITISYDQDDVYNIDEDDVVFATVDGKVTVTGGAAGDPQLVVSSVEAIAGENADVTISLVNNPGIASIKLSVAFPEDLTLTDVVFNDAQLGGQSQAPQKFTSPVTLNWFNGGANTNGDIIYATLKFAVPASTLSGNKPITITYNQENVYNIDEEDVEFEIVNGNVAVTNNCAHATTEIKDAVAATCTVSGYTGDTYCTVCGAKIADGSVINASGHAWGDWVETTAPTCTANGIETRVCANDASHTETREVNAKGHTWGDWVETTAPTCTAKGVETRVCANDASHTETREVNAKGHAWGDWVETTAPTCTAKGVETRVCANDASHTETREVASLPHKLTEVPAKAATTSATGNKAYYVCSECEKLFEDSEGTTETTLDDVTIAKLVKYTVVFNGNGSTSGSMKSLVVTNNNAFKLTANAFKKSGYAFTGWNTKKDGTGTKYADKASVSKLNTTLYAQWTKLYTITYKLNSGTNNSSNPKNFTATTATITLKNPTRKGYSFKGWYSDSKFKTKVTKITKGTKKNITLYAKWTIVTYKITYKLNSGKNNAKNPSTFKVTTATITLKAPTRKGYTFKGWYSDAKFKTKVTKIAKGSTGNKTLYAKWAKK